MKQVYLKLHSRSEEKWDVAVQANGDEKARKIQGLFVDTPKGDFAQLLAEAMREATTFQVPDYLRSAIEVLVHAPESL
jgi:putative ATP-dependent endonuclease of OLD family